ncbi:MAG: hypothetical protein GX811_02795 [Lentisphaerae bacterium]|nr:hypothetical protein [Lentisphaerota bacterium]
MDDNRVSDEQLANEMRLFGSSNPETTVYVRADRDLKYSVVIDVMKILKDAGISRMALITQSE